MRDPEEAMRFRNPPPTDVPSLPESPTFTATPTPPTEPIRLWQLRTAVLHKMIVELYGRIETTEQEAMETLTHICDALNGKDFTLQLSQNWKVFIQNVLPPSES